MVVVAEGDWRPPAPQCLPPWVASSYNPTKTFSNIPHGITYFFDSNFWAKIQEWVHFGTYTFLTYLDLSKLWRKTKICLKKKEISILAEIFSRISGLLRKIKQRWRKQINSKRNSETKSENAKENYKISRREMRVCWRDKENTRETQNAEHNAKNTWMKYKITEIKKITTPQRHRKYGSV